MKKTIFIFFFVILFFYSNQLESSFKKAPSFVLLNNHNKYVYKSKLDGNLLISFWASYCLPCLQEIPKLIALEKKYGKSKKLKLVLINVDVNDQEGRALDKAKKSLKDKDIQHDFLLDIYHKTLERYTSSKKVPATFLVNQKGYIIFNETGVTQKNLSRLEKKIKRL